MRQTPPPTRSGSNPDDIQTVVVPAQPGSYPQASPSQGAAAPPTQPPAIGSGNAKLVLGMLAGALVVCVLGLGAMIWLQADGNHGPATPPGPSSPLVQPASKEEPTKEESTKGVAQPQLTAKAKSPDQEPVSADPSKSEHVPMTPELSG